MKIIKVKNKEELSEKATELFMHTFNKFERPIIGLATGSTPEGMYEKLTEKCQRGEISFKNVVTFNLDEYAGLSPDNPSSYRYYMDEKFFNGIDINRKNTHIPNGLAPDLKKECEMFEQLIHDAGRIHLLILGIGINGHIGFNEPGTAFDSRTHVVELTESTRQVNSRFFNSVDEVPYEALTMGLGTIMDAKEIILLVQGDQKAEILQKVVHGEVTTDVPASILQRHPNATIITDIDV